MAEANKHVSLLELGCELSDSQPEKDSKKEPVYSAKLTLQKDSDLWNTVKVVCIFIWQIKLYRK
jgi:hypothetical protein